VALEGLEHRTVQPVSLTNYATLATKSEYMDSHSKRIYLVPYDLEVTMLKIVLTAYEVLSRPLLRSSFI
jgi:hypothetical protein